MPCFLVGAGAARQLGAALGVPVHFFTHQQGHVMAALTGADCLHLRRAPFLAFHVSGGTTDALLVEPDESCIIRCRVVGHSLDLKAGQLIDRVGGMLGLPFPAGPALEGADFFIISIIALPIPRPSIAPSSDAAAAIGSHNGIAGNVGPTRQSHGRNSDQKAAQQGNCKESNIFHCATSRSEFLTNILP